MATQAGPFQTVPRPTRAKAAQTRAKGWKAETQWGALAGWPGSLACTSLAPHTKVSAPKGAARAREAPARPRAMAWRRSMADDRPRDGYGLPTETTGRRFTRSRRGPRRQD